MKTSASHLDGRDWYRVKKASRETIPRVLPADWDVAQRYENAAHYVTRGGLGVIVEIEIVDGELWTHVSVSRRDRLPSWEDLRHVKEVVIGRDRKAIQVLPPEAEYVNINPNVLHLYCALERDPLPDFRMVDGEGRQGI